jgi:hypothetical protein
MCHLKPEAYWAQEWYVYGFLPLVPLVVAWGGWQVAQPNGRAMRVILAAVVAILLLDLLESLKIADAHCAEPNPGRGYGAGLGFVIMLGGQVMLGLVAFVAGILSGARRHPAT